MADIVRIQHQVPLIGQPNDVTCWMAAANMLLNRRATLGAARTEADGTLAEGDNNIREFARANGFRMYYGQSWTAQGLIALLRKGPAGMFGRMPDLHAIVITGLESDGTEAGTYLTIHDPRPVGQGTLWRNYPYVDFMQDYPASTNYMLQR